MLTDLIWELCFSKKINPTFLRERERERNSPVSGEINKFSSKEVKVREGGKKRIHGKKESPGWNSGKGVVGSS